MPQDTHPLFAIYIDGETKTGKGAAGKAIAATLEKAGYHVSYEVAGDFFRSYTARVRERLDLDDHDPLPTGTELERVAQQLYDESIIFEAATSSGDLQRPAIAKSVATLSELPLVQKAGGEWYGAVVQKAYEARAQVLVLDGRNPRARVTEYTQVPVRTILDLYLTCEANEAARRVLLSQGVDAPTAEQLDAAREVVTRRREHDRHRSINPFLAPDVGIPFVPGSDAVQTVIEQSWQSHGDAELPLPITLDNTNISKADMLTAVSDLTLAAVTYRSSND